MVKQIVSTSTLYSSILTKIKSDYEEVSVITGFNKDDTNKFITLAKFNHHYHAANPSFMVMANTIDNAAINHIATTKMILENDFAMWHTDILQQYAPGISVKCQDEKNFNSKHIKKILKENNMNSAQQRFSLTLPLIALIVFSFYTYLNLK